MCSACCRTVCLGSSASLQAGDVSYTGSLSCARCLANLASSRRSKLGLGLGLSLWIPGLLVMRFCAVIDILPEVYKARGIDLAPTTGFVLFYPAYHTRDLSIVLPARETSISRFGFQRQRKGLIEAFARGQ